MYIRIGLLHLFSVYFDLNTGCLIIGILKYEEHGHDNKVPQIGTCLSEPDNWDPFEKGKKGPQPRNKKAEL